MPDRPGLLLILSSPSGAGKTTLARRLLRAHDDLRFSVSYTTRPARRGEQDGQDYHFVDDGTFDALVERNAFAEWCVVHGNRYGTTVEDVTATRGRNVVLELDPQGAEKLRARFPAEALLVYVLPPSMQVLERRLRGRGTDSEAVIERRLAKAPEEMRRHVDYHYVVVNDRLEVAFAELDAIYQHERGRLGPQAPADLVALAARCARDRTAAGALAEAR